MAPSNQKRKPLIPGNPFIPPFDQTHIDQIFTNYIKSGNSLHYSVSKYLQKLCMQYLGQQGKILAAIYQLDIHDLSMYRLGLDAPFSIIIGAELKRYRYHPSDRLEPLLIPSKESKRESYIIDLSNRADVFSTTIDPTDISSSIKVFDSLLEKPPLPGEEYFLAGVETGKLLYQKAVTEVNLRFVTPQAP